MAGEQSNAAEHYRQAAPDFGAAQGDFVRTAFDDVRQCLSADGSAPAETSLTRQKTCVIQWARGAGLLLTAEQFPQIFRGGQEHDLYHEEATDRYFKITRNGMFGLSPGMDIALVSSDQDGRRFQLWEAMPFDYLERLVLHNELVPGLNRLEGILAQPNDDLAIVTSQPRFDIVPVNETEIDNWFSRQGFRKITQSAYYREEDNLGVFDAHDKNVIRAGEWLVPFDVIPCHPAPGFQKFIQDTLNAGKTLRAERIVSPALSNS